MKIYRGGEKLMGKCQKAALLLSEEELAELKRYQIQQLVHIGKFKERRYFALIIREKVSYPYVKE